ncbi:MAG: dihydroorotase [Clostridia bacterium]
MLLIKNGTIVDPYTKIQEKLDILVNDKGIIVEISENITADCEVLDATNCFVSPGFIDAHVHFRTPGGEHKETVETGALSAAAGGFTTVVCMANTNPVIDDEENLANILEINAKAPINVLQCATITTGFNGRDITDFKKLRDMGAVGFTDDGIYIKDAKTSYDAMKIAKELNVPISLHEEDTSLIHEPGVNFESAYAEFLGIKGATPESESVAVARDIALAISTKARVNFQHISTKESVALIKFGKKQGAKIFAEVTPHHLALTEDDLKICGANAKMNPPLRREEDRQALIKGLKDGTIDMIATDHAPHSTEEKSRQFLQCPSGIIGLETAFSVCYTNLCEHMTLMQLVEKMTVKPAKLYNLKKKALKVKNKSEIVVYSTAETMIYDDFYSKSSNTPFSSIPLKGKIIATVMGDKIIYRG